MKNGICVDYIANNDSDNKATKKVTESTLYKNILKKIAKGENQMGIIRHFRGKGNKTPDILRAIQLAKSAEVQMEVFECSKCDGRKGKTDEKNGEALSSCGHWRCKEHWDLFLTSQVKSGIACLQTRCNYLKCKKLHSHSWKDGCFCQERVPRELFNKYITSQKLKDRFNALCLKNFKDFSRNAGIGSCPKCSRWWKKTNEAMFGQDTNADVSGSKSKSIECECGHNFCLKCGLGGHEPLPCRNAIDFEHRGNDNVQTRLWKELNTAPCPNPECGIYIERYVTNEDHCLHMICPNCKFHWCWACRQRFKVGGDDANHDNYYKCRNLQSGSVDEQVLKRERILRESKMHQFYKQKYDECEDDIIHLKLLRSQLQDKIGECKESKEKDYDFLLEAVDNLITATNRKKVLNPVAFYSAADAKKKLFEFQLKLMEERYDKLLDMIVNKTAGGIVKNGGAYPNRQAALLAKLQQQQQQQATSNLKSPSLLSKKITAIKQYIKSKSSTPSRAPAAPTTKPITAVPMRKLEYYIENKKRIVEAAHSVKEFFEKLFQMVRNGNLVTILDKPDPNNKTWYCSKCQRENEFGKNVCECAWTAVK
mmetsp:Transcript_8046/g.11274  ORF Transcript_8046/g.11274 Transcript_8046/m.11274 type:complete len:594 (-) Transcript_8046:66-1847(-)